jgi:hypothetical protein
MMKKNNHIASTQIRNYIFSKPFKNYISILFIFYRNMIRNTIFFCLSGFNLFRNLKITE